MTEAPAHRLPHLLHGSSPHVRGTPKLQLLDAVVVRFIPACAGNARARSRRCARPSVHPRIRGERIDLYIITQGPNGSSPHTRGTHERTIRRAVADRFIPAYAGNACAGARPSPCPAVHPRIRGERVTCQRERWKNVGSSPHTRGTLPPSRRWHAAARFIPAYAGNALPISY